MVQIIKKQIKKIECREKNFFRILFSVLIFFIMSYGFLLNSTMMNILSKQSIEKETISLSSDVNSLEFVYLNIKNSINLELAKSKGFVLAPSDDFVIINSTQKNLSLSVKEK